MICVVVDMFIYNIYWLSLLEFIYISEEQH